MNELTWLPLVWAAILGTAVALYVLLDGFDLGLGILFPASPREDHRDLMMNSVAPFWDGNQTWLVLGGGGLFVAFPKAYGVLMSAVYLPVIIMLLALVFRGVSFEYRWVAKPKHQLWDIAFAWGSIVAAFMQGIILGALVQGIPSQDGVYTGGSLDWLTPFSIFTGLATMAGYALLGACWLVMKTDGEVAATARERAKRLLVVVLAAMAIVSVWTPLMSDRIWERWFTMSNLLYLSPIPVITALAALSCWRGLTAGHDTQPFLSAVAIFLLGLVGLGVSTLPYMVPPSLTIAEAAAAPSSQMFMLVGTLIMLPIILGYTIFVYRTFRGKLKPGEGYH
jgi:cytochrome d ubiquinol oxidase subunit II